MKLSLFLLLLFLFTPSYSQIPQLISYQGVLTDNSGNLVSDGNYNLTFNLYTVAVGGSSIWTETQSVTTSQGVFNVNLGSVTSFTIGFSSQYYLGVTVGGVEMTPRTQLTSAAYAMNGNPPGTVLAYVGTTAPPGFLICDGSAVSRTNYSALFAIIGTSFGSGDGTTTFNLPDMRGRFIRGFDGSANNDPDKATRIASNSGGNTGNNIGSLQEDAFQGHAHDVFQNAQGGAGWADLGSGGTTATNFRNAFDFVAGETRNIKADYLNASWGTPRVSSETRPENIYMNYIIKY
jgi:microcystin-dependent protein